MGKNNRILTFVLILITAILFFGGLGIEKNLVEVSGIIFGTLLLFFAKNVKGSLAYPAGFSLYLVFLILAVVSSLWSKDVTPSFEYLALFGSGGLFWLSFYNLKEEFRKPFPVYLMVLGFIFSFSYLFYIFKGEGGHLVSSLVAPYTGNHHHLGDYWVITSLILFYQSLKKPNWGLISALIIAVSILAFSLSRSAYVAVAVGGIYLFFKNGKAKKLKKFLIPALILSAALFLYASSFKTTLYSRIYFLEGVVGFVKNPLGVGLGNFDLISRNPPGALWNMDFYSSLAHNIFLEVLVGMGVLGLVFVVWFFKVAAGLWRQKGKEALIYQSLFFAITANFFFDTTYVIPTMLWLWFAFLGLAQEKSEGE
jgi:hypothetical protein